MCTYMHTVSASSMQREIIIFTLMKRRKVKLAWKVISSFQSIFFIHYRYYIDANSRYLDRGTTLQFTIGF